MRRVSFLSISILLGISCFAQQQKMGSVTFSENAIGRTAFNKDTFNIISYGAKADGMTLNTKSINAAIDDCNKKGGGVVVIPAGLWLTGPVTLKSNVNLHLMRDALLQFTTDFSQYPLVKANWEGVPQMRNQSPISAS